MAVEYPAQTIDFAQKSIDPAAWFSTAVSVYIAADTLWIRLYPALRAWEERRVDAKVERALRLRGPYALLVGLAIEGMLKSAILKQTPRHERRPMRTHNLVALSKRLDLEWSEDQLELLGRLTTFITWAGRYPVALTEKASAAPRTLKSTDYLTMTSVATQLHDIHVGRLKPKLRPR